MWTYLSDKELLEIFLVALVFSAIAYASFRLSALQTTAEALTLPFLKAKSFLLMVDPETTEHGELLMVLAEDVEKLTDPKSLSSQTTASLLADFNRVFAEIKQVFPEPPLEKPAIAAALYFYIQGIGEILSYRSLFFRLVQACLPLVSPTIFLVRLIGFLTVKPVVFLITWMIRTFVHLTARVILRFRQANEAFRFQLRHAALLILSLMPNGANSGVYLLLTNNQLVKQFVENRSQVNPSDFQPEMV